MLLMQNYVRNINRARTLIFEFLFELEETIFDFFLDIQG